MILFSVIWVSSSEIEIVSKSELKHLKINHRIIFDELSKIIADEYARILNIGAPNEGIYISIPQGK